jgi:sugar lactone lactonase YvrE
MNIDLKDVSFTRPLFSRPECVLCCASGDMFASHRGAAVIHFRPDGTHRILGEKSGFTETEAFTPNGIALDTDGTIFIANLLSDGGIWKVGSDNQLVPYLLEVDGVKLESTNFVMIDHDRRMWITCSTRSADRAAPMTRGVSDGYIVLADKRGARIVADGFAMTNECRPDSDNKALYVCETAGACISRLRILASGDLGPRETWAEFSRGIYPDGCAFDVEGYLWMASPMSNRVVRIAPNGSYEIVLEDVMPGHIDRVESARADKTFGRKYYYEPSGRKVNALTSVAFGGPDLKTVYLGSLIDNRLASFRSPVAGVPLPHWKIRRQW